MATPPLEEIQELLRLHQPGQSDHAALAALTTTDLEAALHTIDPYAQYFAATDYAAVDHGQTGIGAALVIRPDYVELVPYQGGALRAAGTPERVMLQAIDGLTVTPDMDREDIARRLRGAEGTRVALQLATLDQQDQWTVEVVRQAYRLRDVEVYQWEHYRILRVHYFVTGLTRSALRASSNEVTTAQTLVIDLRDATGGDLHEAFDSAALFLPQGAPLGELHRYNAPVDSFKVYSDPPLSMKLVIVVGADTASAAEIFAGVLQHHERAVVVGQPTFGKCSTQTDIRLSNGAVLRLTNGQVLLPNATPCPVGGLIPDIVIPEADLVALRTLLPHITDVLPP